MFRLNSRANILLLNEFLILVESIKINKGLHLTLGIVEKEIFFFENHTTHYTPRTPDICFIVVIGYF